AAGANYLFYRHHHRWDLTEAGVYTLSPQSKKVVGALTEDLEMTAFVEAGQDPQLQSLLDSYKYANPAHLKFRLVDPDKEPALVDQMKITTARSVNLQYGKESFVVTQPTEETVTNGLIRVTGTTKKVVYFTEGNGEADIADQQEPKGYAGAKLALEQENYEVKPLVLPAAETIPDDATALVKTSASSRALAKVDELFSKGTATVEETDRKGPLTVAVAVTAKLKDLGVTPAAAAEGKPAPPDEARLVVFGTSLFADNQQL